MFTWEQKYFFFPFTPVANLCVIYIKNSTIQVEEEIVSDHAFSPVVKIKLF